MKFSKMSKPERARLLDKIYKSHYGKLEEAVEEPGLIEALPFSEKKIVKEVLSIKDILEKAGMSESQIEEIMKKKPPKEEKEELEIVEIPTETPKRTKRAAPLPERKELELFDEPGEETIIEVDDEIEEERKKIIAKLIKEGFSEKEAVKVAVEQEELEEFKTPDKKLKKEADMMISTLAASAERPAMRKKIKGFSNRAKLATNNDITRDFSFKTGERNVDIKTLKSGSREITVRDFKTKKVLGRIIIGQTTYGYLYNNRIPKNKQSFNRLVSFHQFLANKGVPDIQGGRLYKDSLYTSVITASKKLKIDKQSRKSGNKKFEYERTDEQLETAVDRVNKYLNPETKRTESNSKQFYDDLRDLLYNRVINRHDLKKIAGKVFGTDAN